MRKILLTLAALLATLSLAGCSDTTDGGIAATAEINYNRDHAHIQLNENTIVHRDVLSYRRNDEVVELNLKNYGWITVDLKNAVLYSGNNCPVCK